MGRPRGSRNADYHDKRKQLARKVAITLVQAPAEHTSLRELARAADVSVSTMRHYFEDRNGLVEAALQEMGATARRRLDEALVGLPRTCAHERLAAWLDVLVHGWTTYRVGRAHAVGLAEGLYADTGPSYVRFLYQPFLDATVRVLKDLEAEGHATFTHHALAAQVLLAPIQTMLYLHESLGPSDSPPSDIDQAIDEHVARFLKGWVDLN